MIITAEMLKYRTNIRYIGTLLITLRERITIRNVYHSGTKLRHIT